MLKFKESLFELAIVALMVFTPIQSIISVNATENPIAVLLTGTSSSGKTSTTKALSKLWGDSYAIVNIDDFVDGKDWECIKEKLSIEWGFDKSDGSDLGSFIENYLGQSDRQVERQLFQSAFQNGLVEYIQHIASSSKNIVVDTVDPYIYDNFSIILPNSHIVKVLLYCPLSVIGQRIEKRNMSDNLDEHRDLYAPFLAFPRMYKIKESDDEIVVDKIVYSHQLKQLLVNGIDSAKKDYFSTYDDPEGLADFEKFYKNYSDKLEEEKEIVVVTRTPFDLVINTDVHSPDEAAKIIVDFVVA